MDDREARELVARVEALLEEVEGLEPATQLVQSLVDLYGESLRRIVAGGLPRELAEDELIGHLLLLHGLHPVPVGVRVREALAEVSPYLESHGGGVELIGVDDGVVRLRLEGSCNGCPSSAVTLKLAIEDAIHKHAPDVERVEADSPPAAPAGGLLQLEISDSVRAWSAAGGIADLPAEAPVVRAIDGEALVFVRLGKAAYAYRPECAACGGALADGSVNGAFLTCGGCGSRFDVRHAGRCPDAPEQHLEPVPLLVDAGGSIKVALGATA